MTTLTALIDEVTDYQRHAMTVPCHYCGAAVGEPCVPPDYEVPADACRVHVVRAIAADYATPAAEVPDAS